MKIFISYRRDDTKDLSARICDRLRSKYGETNVFLDSGSIRSGAEWRKLLLSELHSCDALIAVIGDNWLEVRDKDGKRRLDNPEDEVRREIATAFDRGIPIIPLLVEGTKMPEPDALPQPLQQLHERQWLEIRSDQYFDNDVKLLCSHVDALRKSNLRLRGALLVCIAIVLVLGGIVLGLVLSPRSGQIANPENEVAVGAPESSSPTQSSSEKLLRKKLSEIGITPSALDVDESGNVVRVELFGYHVTDEAVKRIAQFEQLKVVGFTSTLVTGNGLRHLKGLREITSLSLHETALRDSDIEPLSSLRTLTSLNLNGTSNITDDGLRHLQGLTRLEYLGLYRTKVGDAGLQYLYDLTDLRTVDLYKTAVTDDGIHELKMKLPNVGVKRSSDLNAIE